MESDYVNGISTNTATTPRTYGNILNPPSPATAPTGLWRQPGTSSTSPTYMQLGALSTLETLVLTYYPYDPTNSHCSMGRTWPFASATQATTCAKIRRSSSAALSSWLTAATSAPTAPRLRSGAAIACPAAWPSPRRTRYMCRATTIIIPTRTQPSEFHLAIHPPIHTRRARSSPTPSRCSPTIGTTSTPFLPYLQFC